MAHVVDWKLERTLGSGPGWDRGLRVEVWVGTGVGDYYRGHRLEGRSPGLLCRVNRVRQDRFDLRKFRL